MSTDTPLTLALARTRPVTYYMTNNSRPDCLDAVVFQHWTDPIEILVSRPDSAPFITFAKYVNAQLAIRVTTPAQQIGARVHVPDAVLCWATLERFTVGDADREAGHLIVRDGKIFSQRKTRGSDARPQRDGGSDASESGGRAPARARAPRRAGPAPRAPRAPRAPVSSSSSGPRSSSTVHRGGIPAAIARTIRAAILAHRARRDPRGIDAGAIAPAHRIERQKKTART